jgi:ElaB/YqjD/DUF883 family membrane-anchored ribosome-binding protein
VTSVSDTAERVRGEAERLRDELEHRFGPEAVAAAERAVTEAERLRRERLDPAVERARQRAPEYAERVAERSREVVEHAREHAPEYAERVADAGRESAERVAAYLEEHVDEETLRVWGPRLLFALLGFVVGFLLGRAVAGGGSEDAAGWDDPGLAHAPADRDRGQSGEAPPPTRMPAVGETVEAGGDGHQDG